MLVKPIWVLRFTYIVTQTSYILNSSHINILSNVAALY